VKVCVSDAFICKYLTLRRVANTVPANSSECRPRRTKFPRGRKLVRVPGGKEVEYESVCEVCAAFISNILNLYRRRRCRGWKFKCEMCAAFISNILNL